MALKGTWIAGWNLADQSWDEVMVRELDAGQRSTWTMKHYKGAYCADIDDVIMVSLSVFISTCPWAGVSDSVSLLRILVRYPN